MTKTFGMTMSEYLVHREMAWQQMAMGKRPSMLDVTASELRFIAANSSIYSDERNDWIVLDHQKCERLWPEVEKLMKERAENPENFHEEIVQ